MMMIPSLTVILAHLALVGSTATDLKDVVYVNPFSASEKKDFANVSTSSAEKPSYELTTIAAELDSKFEGRDIAYFDYYAQLYLQQNMLQDSIRTTAYHRAILDNAQDFKGKVVMDLGCGSGILSFFAAKAGASRVYAVEAAPEMARKARKLAVANGFGDIIKVVAGKVEELPDDAIPEKVDVLISEPMGVYLVHERMLESYVFARDRYLRKPYKQAAMWPSVGTIYMAAFSDQHLYNYQQEYPKFWETTDFYGLNMSVLAQDAKQEALARPVVGPVDPKSLYAKAVTHPLPFWNMSMADLQHFKVSLDFTATATGILHGIAVWFDTSFTGTDPSKASILSTAPDASLTHWYQGRLLFPQPIAVNEGQKLKGSMEFKANSSRSHFIGMQLELEGTDVRIGEKGKPFIYPLHNHSYYDLSGENIAKSEK